MKQIDVSQRFRENTGNVVGVKADTIHGDVHVEQNEIHLVLLGEHGRVAITTPTYDPRKSPYRGARPFRYEHHGLFFGREAEVGQILTQAANHPITLIYGNAGIGKTSLLEAGVKPRFAQPGAAVFTIDGPARTSALLRTALEELDTGGDLTTPLPQESNISALISSLAPEGTVVLMFDQFESITQMPAIDRSQLAGELRVLLETRTDARLIFATTTVSYPEVDRFIQTLHSDRGEAVEVGPLSQTEAFLALNEPLGRLEGPVAFINDQIATGAVADLDEITEGSDRIEPLHLQLLAEGLFRLAQARREIDGRTLIDESIYSPGSAVGIVTQSVEMEVDRLFPDNSNDARQVISALVSQPDQWATVADLERLTQNEIDVDSVLERLAQAGIVRAQQISGTAFGFPSEAARLIALQVAGEQAMERRRAHDMLDGKWATWRARGTILPRGDLRYLASISPPLATNLEETLLLLRSAVFHHEDTSVWYSRLTSMKHQALQPLADLEHRHDADPDSTLGQLLNLSGEPLPGAAGFGPLAWTAATSTRPAVRHTAFLVLSTMSDGLERLTAALFENSPDDSRIDPALWAGLDAAAGGLGKEWGQLTAPERRIFRREQRRVRLRRSLRGLMLMAWFGATGAGLGVAAYWFVRSWATRETWGSSIALGWLWGFVLVVLPVLAVRALRTLRSPDDSPPLWQEAALAGIVFLAGDLVVANGNGFSITRWTLPRLIAFGVGVTIWAVDRSWRSPGETRRNRTHLFAVAGAAVAFGLLQWIRAAVDGGILTSINQAGDFLEAQLDFGDPTVLTSIDSVLLGLGMSSGLIIGLTWGAKVRERWKQYESRTGA